MLIDSFLLLFYLLVASYQILDMSPCSLQTDPSSGTVQKCIFPTSSQYYSKCKRETKSAPRE